MAKVHFVNDATVYAAALGLEGATPIVPLRAVVLQFPKPQELDDLPIPSAPLSIAVHPEVARGLAEALLQAADELDQT